MRQLNEDDRAVMALEREARRVSEAAERVNLVVRAMAQRRGLVDQGRAPRGSGSPKSLSSSS